MSTFGSVFELSSLDGTNGFQISGEVAYDRSGYSVSDAGDVNGDGFGDLIIGAYRAGPNGDGSGAAYIVFGSVGGFNATLNLSALDGTNGFQISGEAGGDVLGGSVSTAGDVNGDGFDDLIIGAYGAEPNGELSGASYVVFGKAGGFTANLDLSLIDGSTGFRINGESADDRSGTTVASAGDLNGDGFDDLIIGAVGADTNSGLNGASYVVFGKAGGVSANLNLSALDGTNGFKISGNATSTSFAFSISEAGDVNGDGFEDLIIGAPGAYGNGREAGTSIVVFGKSGGFAANLDLAGINVLDGTNGFLISGAAAGDRSGGSVSAAGDVNGDGFGDLIIGATGADPNGGYSGASYIVFGKAGSFSAVLDLSTLIGTNGFRINGEAANDRSGRSVSAAGDVNGDGFDDVIIGAYAADPNGDRSGAAYVVFGNAGGFNANLNLSTLDGTTGFQISGEAAEDLSGRSVSAAGDVNGDGFDDILVGANGADPNGSDTGATYIIFGKATSGTDNDDVLDASGANDTLAGLGGNDIIRGNAGNDTLNGGDGNDRVFGGSGVDTLVGGAGNDLLDGGTSIDSFFGGSGNDIFVIDSLSDVLIEASGTDEVRTGSFSLSLAIPIFAEIENASLTGSGAFNLTGTSAANVLTGNSGINTLDGGGGIDTLAGGAGNDTYLTDGDDTITEGAGGGTDSVLSSATFTLSANIERLTLTGNTALSGTGNAAANTITGNGANNTLNGAGGTDTLIGGAGNDAYLTDGSDTITEVFKGGTDTVFSSATHTLAANIENLTLLGFSAISGTGNTATNTIIGNGGNNTLNGAGGTDTLLGAAGNDTYITDGGDTITESSTGGTDTVQSSVTWTLSANVENLTLTGNSAISGIGNTAANTITGNGGNNTLNGAGGTDTLIGLAGNDTYVIDAGGTITEASNGGTDTVRTSATLTLGANLENLILIGGFAISGTGNAGTNTITGNAGNNTLNGAGGTDTFIGGFGSDTYITDGADTITEASNAGTDTVRSSAIFTLGENLENLILTGNSAHHATGNSAANTITGNGGDNSINGRQGNDVLTGGGGNDKFVFNTSLGAGNIDRITDFREAQDSFRLDDAVFTGLALGVVKPSALVSNISGNAGDASDRIIYEKDTGMLFFDKDGTGDAAKVHFATMDTKLSLLSAEFFVF